MLDRMKYIFYFVILLCLGSCSTIVTEEDLIGGEWKATAGYENGEPVGEPYCLPSVWKGLEFKDKETVYVEAYDSDFSYWIEKSKGGPVIYFQGEDFGIYDKYYIDKINEDEVGLTGKGNLGEGESCYMERQ
ncbi:hypothetical protein [Oceanobacillus sp. J11TS1]|uniref:hypothetical protein n=1 Tax=Oceanobacillus sp. J11TS1 TaxID=2807191 RepID=UPI001B18AB0F|nr:hypothetical protein [Oceanobacillus sp. J11TS1]GIO23546.1 hypothetical protein J11TS1_21270 [Oceanobacillus sp. J11TS1]